MFKREMPGNGFPALLLGIEADKSRNFRDKVQYFTDIFCEMNKVPVIE